MNRSLGRVGEDADHLSRNDAMSALVDQSHARIQWPANIGSVGLSMQDFDVDPSHSILIAGRRLGDQYRPQPTRATRHRLQRHPETTRLFRDFHFEPCEFRQRRRRQGGISGLIKPKDHGARTSLGIEFRELRGHHRDIGLVGDVQFDLRPDGKLVGELDGDSQPNLEFTRLGQLHHARSGRNDRALIEPTACDDSGERSLDFTVLDLEVEFRELSGEAIDRRLGGGDLLLPSPFFQLIKIHAGRFEPRQRGLQRERGLLQLSL